MNKRLVSLFWIWLSVLTIILVTLTSLLGIFNPLTYSQETSNWATQAVGQDIANLVVVGLLSIATYHLGKNSFRAYLVWLGCFLYLGYAFTIYAFFIHFNALFLIYITLLGLSLYVPVGSLLGLDFKPLSKRFHLRTHVRPASLLLLSIGILFGLLWLGEIVPNLLSGQTPKSLLESGLWVNPVHVLDLGLLLPAMIITAVLMSRRLLLGYFLSVPLLVFSATMGFGIISLFSLIALDQGGVLAPPVYVIGFLVLASIYFSYCLLRQIKD